MRKSFSRISFFVLTALLIGGSTNFMVQDAYSLVTTVTITEPVAGTSFGANFSIDYTVADDGANSATAGSITFTRTGGTADAGTHVYTMAVPADTSTGAHSITRATLEADVGFDALVDGSEYTIVVSITDTGAFSDTELIVTADFTEPSFTAAYTTATTITLTWNENVDSVIDTATAGNPFILGGTALTVASTTALDGTGNTQVLTLSGPIPNGSTIDVSYDTDAGNGDIEDTADTDPNAAPDRNNINVTGIPAAAAAPASNSGGGSGCDDCEAPTLGVDKRGTQLVSNGFTYNGHSVNAERFFTPYPLITANVGKTNIAEFKLYENEGVSNIRHFTLAFGMDKGDIISDSKAKIELDIDHEGTETVTVTDPENVLDNIKVTTSTVSCSDESFLECLGISIQHRFRAPLDFNIVGTDVWDSKRNAWQNTFNHGIEVVGESLNPAKEYDGINKGHIYHLTETSKTTAIDEFGNSWSFNYGLWNMDYIDNKNTPVTLVLKKIIPTVDGFAGSDQFGTMYYLTQTSEITAVDMFDNAWSLESGLWTMDSIYSQMILDSTPMAGYTRADSEFSIYKYGQSILAENKLGEICSNCFDERYGEINNIFAYDFPLTE